MKLIFLLLVSVVLITIHVIGAYGMFPSMSLSDNGKRKRNLLPGVGFGRFGGLGDLVPDEWEVDELDGRDDMDEKVVEEEEEVHGNKDDVCIKINVDQFHCNNITIY
eukprot:XP_011417191.1 PREDICTED: uncharacterized protein LOC105320812 [Crassostrea gigas]